MKNFLQMSFKEFIQNLLEEHGQLEYKDDAFFHHDEIINGRQVLIDGRLEKRNNEMVWLYLNIFSSSFRIYVGVTHVFEKGKTEYFINGKKMKPKTKMLDAISSYLAYEKRETIKKVNKEHVATIEYLKSLINKE